MGNPEQMSLFSFIQNPVIKVGTNTFSLSVSGNIDAIVCALRGRLVKDRFKGYLNTGPHQFNLDVNYEKLENGIYFLKVSKENVSGTFKFVVDR